MRRVDSKRVRAITMPDSLPSPRLRALIFDLDGTLYSQVELRAMMLTRMVREYWNCPGEGWATIRILRAYRLAQERLRRSQVQADLKHAQEDFAARIVGCSICEVQRCIYRWFDSEPLPLLIKCMRPGVRKLLSAALEKGIKLAVFSDYEAEEKLRAMKLRKFFDVVVCANDSEVREFKPSATGLRVTLERLGVSAQEALYVGDRADLDTEAAHRANLEAVIIGGCFYGNVHRRLQHVLDRVY